MLLYVKTGASGPNGHCWHLNAATWLAWPGQAHPSSAGYSLALPRASTVVGQRVSFEVCSDEDSSWKEALGSVCSKSQSSPRISRRLQTKKRGKLIGRGRYQHLPTTHLRGTMGHGPWTTQVQAADFRSSYYRKAKRVHCGPGIDATNGQCNPGAAIQVMKLHNHTGYDDAWP